MSIVARGLGLPETSLVASGLGRSQAENVVTGVGGIVHVAPTLGGAGAWNFKRAPQTGGIGGFGYRVNPLDIVAAAKRLQQAAHGDGGVENAAPVLGGRGRIKMVRVVSSGAGGIVSRHGAAPQVAGRFYDTELELFAAAALLLAA